MLHPARGLIGASWIVDVSLTGALDAQGMVFDFGPAKREIKKIIDATGDHKLIVAQDDPRLDWQCEADRVALTYRDDRGGQLTVRSPRQAFCVLPGKHADAETLARQLEQEVLAAMPPNINKVDIRLREEIIDGAAYAYCHGLKKHAGNCQRIAHGHRSRIQIFANDQRSNRHEQQWAEHWQDVYLGQRADLQSDINALRYRFAYDAEQGHFEVELDATRCRLLDTHSTVENIAAHIARTLAQAEPQTRFVVHAFEGVGKGAIAQA